MYFSYLVQSRKTGLIRLAFSQHAIETGAILPRLDAEASGLMKLGLRNDQWEVAFNIQNLNESAGDLLGAVRMLEQHQPIQDLVATVNTLSLASQKNQAVGTKHKRTKK